MKKPVSGDLSAKCSVLFGFSTFDCPLSICHLRIFARESYNSSKKYKLNRVYTYEMKLHENREIEVCSGKTTGYHWAANYYVGKVHPCFVSHAFSSLDKARPPCFHVPLSFKACPPSK